MSLGLVARYALFRGASTLSGPLSRAADYASNWLNPNKLLDDNECVQLYSRGFISAASLERNAKWNGSLWTVQYQPLAWQYFNDRGVLRIAEDTVLQADDPQVARVWAAFEQLDPATLRVLLNRGLIDPNAVDTILRAQGWAHIAERRVIADIRRIIPGPAQMLDYALRGALDPQNLNPQGLLAEYDADFDAWARANGLTTVGIGPVGDDGQPRTLDMARVAWAGHWTYPPLAQYWEMVHRFRPSISDPDVSADPSGIILDPELGDEILRVQGVHPDLRENLEALSWKLPSARWIDQMIEAGTIDQNGLTDILIGSGFHPRIAPKMARARLHKINVTDAKATIAQSKARLEAAWELGIMSDQDYISNLQNVGLAPQDAQVAFQLSETERQRKKISRVLATVRSQVLTGQISVDDGVGLLRTLSLREDRISDYRVDWELELAGRRRIVNAGKVLADTKLGLLSIEQMVSRLANLRYNAADIQLFVGEMQVFIAMRLAKAAADAARAEQKRERAIQQAIKQQEAAKRAAQEALSRHGSPSKLKKWLCDNLIAEPEARARLEFLGWPDNDIDRLIAESCPQPKKPKSTTPATGPQPPGTGG